MAKALAFPGLCRLQVDSTSQISLQRFQGAWLPMKIGGSWVSALIPTSGPTLSNSGLAAATLYYVYAFDSAGTLTLEAVTTVPATDADTGIRIKTGDATRTLVGMVFMDSGSPGTYVDSTAKRWCLNYFQRRSLPLSNTFSADRTTTSTTFTEINTEIRLQYLTWADEAVAVGITGTVKMDLVGNASSTAIGLDSTTVSSQSQAYTAASSPQRGPVSVWLAATQSEGSHFATLLGAVSGSTATWEAADSPSTGVSKTRMWGTVRG